MFDSLKKKFADASGKLRNKVEDEAKEENNVELIEEPSEETFDEIEESEEIEEFSDDEDISEEELDEMLDAALEEESEEDSDADKKEKSGFLGFLKRDKKEEAEEDSDAGLEEEEEYEPEIEEAAEESEEDSQLESVEGSEEEIPEDEVEEEKEEESKKSKRSFFRRKKKEESDESEDEDKKEKSGGFLSFIKEKSISEDDVEDILFELELGLLEADVAMDVSSVVVESVKNDLVGQKIKRSSDIEEYTYKALKNAVSKIIDIEGKSMTELLEEKVAQGEPLVVMLVGINGTGKTTTIGKLSNYYIKKGYTPVIAASDTFRAGAIEQVQYHADNLGVKLIKHEKGSDPAAVAFDAVQHARAKGKELVLIDTAGRMQTNTNLMDEMKKIRRVSKPDLVVFVGDALTGNDATEQARKFNEAIDIDGVILTKADADSKGGAALSIGYIIKKPILFLGMGQSYDDIKEYDADWMLEQIFS
ncbi:signal recognition particle-docking protein FtsY [uncultured Methanobrevibacter sp.]|uniref:signal recognition particle-docking protein FtsY n=1 Tax=uncultured Methanobrevibacter sp. TaxID=253161 RepID=UPI0026268B39|nr:signal recognition particle-docking protein FtsY [uncultured Methanobrevibacter sp.]